MQAALLLALLGACGGVVAAAPPPTQTESPPSAPRGAVFKCDTGGSTLYTDRPCAGGRSIEPIALQGIVRMDDRSPVEGGRGALAPHGGTSKALDASGIHPAAAAPRGIYSAAGVNPECPHLAQRMARVLAEESAATDDTRPLIEERLAIQRQRYRELDC